MNIGYKTAENTKKQAILDLLKDMPLPTLSIAYVYAKNYCEYGEDVTRTWLTAVENSSALEKAYRKGYYDAMERNNRMRDFVSQTESKGSINAVLDKIRAEIEQTAKNKCSEYGRVWTQDVLQIIDKYREEQE